MASDTFAYPSETSNTTESIWDNVDEPIQFWIRAKGHCHDCDYWNNWFYRHTDIFDLSKNWKNAELDTPRRKSAMETRFWISEKHCHECRVAANNFRNYNDIFRIGQRFKNEVTRRESRLAVLSKYSDGIPKCACCGVSEPDFLCLDHVNGGGNQWKKSEVKNGRGADLASWVKKNNYPPGFRVLCFNCNEAIRFDKECPHKRSA